jgi:hypothetical protein
MNNLNLFSMITVSNESIAILGTLASVLGCVLTAIDLIKGVSILNTLKKYIKLRVMLCIIIFIICSVCIRFLYINTIILQPQPQPFHEIKSISTEVHKIDMNCRTCAALLSNQEHFKIRIKGAFFGSGLEKIKKKYENINDVKVYAVVEEYKSDKREILWLQKNEYGKLTDWGHYSLDACLGGVGYDSAKHGDQFLIRIYIPENQEYDFTNIYAVYDEKQKLPKPLFYSEPITIKTLRIEEQ